MAILALRETKNSRKIIIKSKHISEEIDHVKIEIAKYKTKYDKKVKKIIDVHEIGYILVGLYVKESEIVDKITIISHGNAAVIHMFFPKI